MPCPRRVGKHSHPPLPANAIQSIPSAAPAHKLSCSLLYTHPQAVEQEIFKCKRLLADAESAGHVVSSSSLLSSAANCASAPLLATRNMTSAGPGSATAVVSAPASDEECASLLAAPGTPPGAAGAPGELALSRLIGLGGYGTVWCGTWRKVTAAIKVGARHRARFAGAKRPGVVRARRSVGALFRGGTHALSFTRPLAPRLAHRTRYAHNTRVRKRPYTRHDLTPLLPIRP